DVYGVDVGRRDHLGGVGRPAGNTMPLGVILRLVGRATHDDGDGAALDQTESRAGLDLGDVTSADEPPTYASGLLRLPSGPSRAHARRHRGAPSWRETISWIQVGAKGEVQPFGVG